MNKVNVQTHVEPLQKNSIDNMLDDINNRLDRYLQLPKKKILFSKNNE